MDALVFEFMGLAMLALCVVVLAVPSRRAPARHIRAREHWQSASNGNVVD